jgi:hypothetical protein
VVVSLCFLKPNSKTPKLLATSVPEAVFLGSVIGVAIVLALAALIITLIVLWAPVQWQVEPNCSTNAINEIKKITQMRRSRKQELLLAVCGKMGEVIPLLTDNECDACINFLKKVHANATRSVESVPSPAFQKLSLRELLAKAGGEEEGQVRNEKKPQKKSKSAPSPRPPSGKRASKRALWEADDVVPVRKRSVKKAKVAKDYKVRAWDTKKHSVIVSGVRYDAGRDALVVDAKLSTHGRSKANRVFVRPEDVDRISEEYWPILEKCFVQQEVPASFKATRFGASYAKK